MSTALLRFQEANDEHAPSLSVLAAALEACPAAVAILENGKLIYSNRSLQQFSSQGGKVPEPGSHTGFSWQETGFCTEGRTFSLMTLRPPTPVSDSQHLALIGRLVGGVAHDFNNLLTGILLYCDLMLTRVAPANPLAQKVAEIRAAAEQGAGLIRQLMTVGREEKEAPQLVAFNHALREITPLLQHLVGESVQVNIELDKSEGVVAVSLAQAQQIILNLVLNARDATPGGGQVQVSTRSRPFDGTGPTNRIFELVVKDYGTGMDTHTAARIFDPFFTTKGPGQGTGMGLTTVRKIVEDAGGIVSVETSPGEGTQVTIRLPEVEAGSTPKLSKPEDAAEPAKPQPVRPKRHRRGA